MHTIFRASLLFIVFVAFLSIFDRRENIWSLGENTSIPPYLSYESNWAKSMSDNLNVKQKIGQSILLPAFPQEDTVYWHKLGDFIEQYYIGGIVVYKGDALRVTQMINYLQSRAKVPLLVMIDSDFDVQNMIGSMLPFLHQAQLEQISDNSVLFELASILSLQFRRMGIHGIFGPDIHSLSYPENIYQDEEFWNLKKNKVFSLLKAMAENRIFAVMDIQKTEALNFSDSLFVAQLNYLVKKGLGGVRIFESNDFTSENASCFLPKELGYRGISFGKSIFATDSMEKTSSILRKTIENGADLFVYDGPHSGFKLFIDSIEINNKTEENRLISGFTKIMHLKYWLGLHKYKMQSEENIVADLCSPKAESVIRKATESSIILLQNKESQIPLRGLDNQNIVTISFGENNSGIFNKRLKNYAQIKEMMLPKINFKEKLYHQLKAVGDSDLIMVGVFETNQFSVDYGVSVEILKEIESLAQTRNVIYINFAPVQVLRNIRNPENFGAIIQANNDLSFSQDYAAQLIFGGIKADALLSYTLGNFRGGTSFITEKSRLKFSIPEELNIDRKKLSAIDSIVYDGIKNKAFPGCQIVAVKDGVVFFEKNYGYTEYNSKTKIESTHIYDLASLTKILATAPVLMHLYQNKKFDIQKKLKDYIQQTDTTNKGELLMNDILLHQARLKAWIPFYLYTYDKRSRQLRPDLYVKNPDSLHSTQVAYRLYITNSYKDSIFIKILESPLNKGDGYKYSDLGFYLFTKIIEIQSGRTINTVADSLLYAPLGAKSLTYNPLEKFPKEQIVPTENDISFRRQLLQGYVHDYGAAMLGGVAGHAGLFGNALDVAKLMQMYLNKGVYGGEQLISRDAVELFVSRPVKSNRRALIFDMKPVNGNAASVSRYVSEQSYGHTGFTGTIVWADPENNFIFIFLSNRIHPDIENDKILKMSIRPKIHNVFYSAMLE